MNMNVELMEHLELKTMKKPSINIHIELGNHLEDYSVEEKDVIKAFIIREIHNSMDLFQKKVNVYLHELRHTNDTR